MTHEVKVSTNKQQRTASAECSCKWGAWAPLSSLATVERLARDHMERWSK